MTTPGPVALVGGGEWTDGCSFDAELLEASGGSEVVVLPTAAAYEHPTRAVEQATKWFERLGATVRGLPVLRRPDAEDESNVSAVRGARFIYMGGGSPLHLRSVLKESALWHALLSAWQAGAVVAGSSAGAMVLTDPMVDPRGGAFTLGLGLISQVAFIPHADAWSPEKSHRTISLAPRDLPVVEVDQQTALLFHPGTGWSVKGAGNVTVWMNGETQPLEVLPK